MAVLISLTDEFNNPVPQISLGNVSGTVIKKVRVWNNREGKPGIRPATNIVFTLAFPSNGEVEKIIVKNGCITGRCVFSAKKGLPVSSSFTSFPIKGVDFDTIPSGTYNEYEVKIDFSPLNQQQREKIKGKEVNIVLMVQYTEGEP